MYEGKFCKRLEQLRLKKGVSARDMSLSIGQNPGYINNIEAGKVLPSMNCQMHNLRTYGKLSVSVVFDL